jgi:uncharacterized protein YdcH (DUF465 family)
VKLTIDGPVDDILKVLNLGDNIMANLANISTALDDLATTLDAELEVIHEALMNMNNPTQEEIDAVAQRVTDLKDKIANIIP